MFKNVESAMSGVIRIILLLLLLFCLLLTTKDCAAYCEDGKVRITMIDVGQAEAFLIETPSQNILLDTGGPEEESMYALDYYIRRRLMDNREPLLTYDKIILTHPHIDHIAAASIYISNLMNEATGTVIDNGFVSANPCYRQYMKAVADNGRTHQSVKAGDVLDFGNGVEFHVLNPDPNAPFKLVNNQSIVGKLTFGEFSMLFMADAEAQVENFLLDEDISATILKAGHHGSKTSNTPDFVGRVQPTYVLISAGLDNSYGHPHKSVLATFRMFAIPDENIFCTAFNGNVVVESDGTTCTVTPEKVANWLPAYTGERVTVRRID